MTPEFHPLQSSEIENSLLSEVEKQTFSYIETAPVELHEVVARGWVARLRQFFEGQA